MKKILPFLILFLASVATLSQNLYVESLTLDEKNLKAQINPKLDFNDKKCCVIMVSTPNMDDAQRRKLVFKGDMGAEVVSVDFPTGEVELYVSPHAGTLIIAHPDLGKISYDIPIDLKEMKTYNMVLMSAKATTIIEESLTANYLVINVEPKDARVFIDEEFVENKNGAVSKLLSVGVEHGLRIEKNLYHPLDTMVMTNASNTVTINKKLKPAFGYIEVNSLPESGAKVIIDDNEVGVTPYKSGQMASGEYNVQVVKAMYKQSSKIVRVIDGNTTEVSLAMQPNFAEITLTTDSEAILYLDEKNVGVGRWTGRVLAGSHIIEVKKQYHKDVKRTITVEAAKDQTVVLDNPIPICGSLNITSEPLDATIYLDNKEVGKTPKILTQVLIGNHTIRMEKIGYGPYTKNIYVNEGEMNEVSGELSSMKNITIKTDKKGDIVYIDGTKVGETPYLAKLHYGKHTVRVERSSYYVYKEFEVTSSSNSEITLIYGGKISVKTDRVGDKIYIDDKYIGETPKIVDVSAGTHKVQVVRKDYESINKTVNVGSFECVTVAVRLSKNNAKMITIETGSYGDAVYVDGKKVGVTPYQAELDFGTHYIKVERNGISSTASINVNSSCNTNLRINIGGRIKVLTEPANASVYVDNKLCGNSQQLFDVAVGDHVAKAIWVNGTTATKNVHVESGETMHVTLKSKSSIQNGSDNSKDNKSSNQNGSGNSKDNKSSKNSKTKINKHNKIGYGDETFFGLQIMPVGVTFEREKIGEQSFSLQKNLCFGISVDHFFDDMFSFEVDLSLNKQSTFNYINESYDNDNYVLNIPVLARIGYGEGGYYLYAAAGLEPNYNFNKTFGINFLVDAEWIGAVNMFSIGMRMRLPLCGSYQSGLSLFIKASLPMGKSKFFSNFWKK